MLKNTLFYLVLIILTLFGCNNKNKPASETVAKSSGAEKRPRPDTMKIILFFGNSLTAGYGLEPSEAFPALIQEKIDSLNLPYKVINAGLSGETTAGGNSRIDWILRQKVDVFVLELGANDGLRGIPPTESENNLQGIVDKVRIKYPNAKRVMLGMEVPPNMGGEYAAEFRVIFRQVAVKNKMAFVPFLLQGVGGVAELNQSDGIHPTIKGQKILAKNVWEILKDIL